MGLLGEERRKHIIDALRNTGRVNVSRIAADLKVTEVTIRRDLSRLEKRGLLRKSYGGAILSGPPDVDMPVRYRQSRNLRAKQTIGQLASQLINDGDIIFLEAGSTCHEIIPHLVKCTNLTVIVNSLYLMSRLHELTQHKTILTGGEYRPDRMDMVGPTAETAIAQLGGFKAFTGADDIAIDAGLSGADVVTVGFAKLVLKRASEVIFVGDHTKFDNPALYKIADIEALDYIVTDTAPSPQWHHACKTNHIELIYPR